LVVVLDLLNTHIQDLVALNNFSLPLFHQLTMVTKHWRRTWS